MRSHPEYIPTDSNHTSASRWLSHNAEGLRRKGIYSLQFDLPYLSPCRRIIKPMSETGVLPLIHLMSLDTGIPRQRLSSLTLMLYHKQRAKGAFMSNWRLLPGNRCSCICYIMMSSSKIPFVFIFPLNNLRNQYRTSISVRPLAGAILSADPFLFCSRIPLIVSALSLPAPTSTSSPVIRRTM